VALSACTARPASRTFPVAGQRLQIYVKLEQCWSRAFELFQMLDLGDFVGLAGHFILHQNGELTVWVTELTLLSKALLPLPEKWHGRRRRLDGLHHRRFDFRCIPGIEKSRNSRMICARRRKFHARVHGDQIQ